MIIVGADTETTGLDPEKGHRIIEACFSIYQVQDGQVKKLKDWVKRMNPARPIDAAASAVHKITLADVQHEPTMDALIGDIEKILSAAHLLVIHNAEFDIGFLAAELNRYSRPIPEVDVFCTMENGRFAHEKGGMPNLGKLCFATGVDYDPSVAHAADYDVACMMAAFFEGIRLGGFEVNPEQYPELASLAGAKQRIHLAA